MSKKAAQGEADGPYDKSIRKRLTRTVLIPSVTLLVLWIALSSYFFVNGLYVRLVAASVREVSIPATTALAAVQQERQAALQYLDNPVGGQTRLQERQRATDGKLVTLQAAFASTISSAPEQIAAKVDALKGQFDQLPVLRSQIGFRSIDRAQVNRYYNGVLDTAADLFDTQARIVPDAPAAYGGVTATSVFRAEDLMSRETSMVSTALASGRFSPDEFVLFTRLSGFYRTQLAQLEPFLDPEVRARYQALTTGPAWQQLSRAEEAIVKHGPWAPGDEPGPPVAAADWQGATDQVAAALNDLATGQADKVAGAAIASGDAQLRNAIIGSVLALLASLAAIIVAVRVSRSLVDRALMSRLARLRNDSLDLARNRLPGIVSRLKNGEPVDVAEELPRLDHGRDEIGQVAEAFNLAQLTAVNAAASEAKARSGVHNVFLGIAHRNQVLVHQQLQILDELERREENSTQLASLFQLDHLAARARRTTENLIILGGKQPGRRWRKPVPLMEVLRAAVSETEQYARVRVEQVADVAITGAAVADTVHLIAELVDNATSFSPPGSPVEVTSRTVARGVVVDVSDQGLGMKDGVRDWANGMMAEAPEFDAMALRADSSLGLFVVARLAARLGITVTFDPSRYGGLRATVLIPAQHLDGEGRSGGAGDAASVPPEDTAVFAPVGAPAPRAGEGAQPGPEPPRSFTGQIPVRREAPAAREPWIPLDRGAPAEREAPVAWKPRSAPARPHTQPEPEPAAPATVWPTETPAAAEEKPEPRPVDARPRLPRREPQQNLVTQLEDEPEDQTGREVPPGEGTARSLAAFHRGTRRARDGAGDS
ncbi:nitrate- and nitrite sensing domain-containing protein [Amycolatopsis sp. PS_44_ISF1]|uniref:sensor histidine kinase n=1 Tax=Amycolatopsis sp. PS_44_ISF1 TaxID=2974917 RepID=UPI0028DE46F9|nr:nitrate- and nitrite sensing domain-containing protein [Amycolatopsis sp. PS_44_ISF1]MDT8913255.1 nitrate- and nitrite sensing domain-containing protein [Amycolatopsis sp. PS_44_ISF1]